MVYHLVITCNEIINKWYREHIRRIYVHPKKFKNETKKRSTYEEGKKRGGNKRKIKKNALDACHRVGQYYSDPKYKDILILMLIYKYSLHLFGDRMAAFFGQKCF